MAATRWGCLVPGKISEDFFMAIKENLPAQDHKVCVNSVRMRAQDHKACGHDVCLHLLLLNHFFDTSDRIRVKGKRKSGLISAPECPAKRQKGVRQYHSSDESKILAHFVAVASRDLAKAQTFADRFGFERAYDSYEEVGQDSDVVCVSGCVSVCLCVRLAGCLAAWLPACLTSPFYGGGFLDIGIYVVQLACMVFNEMPVFITAVGNLMGAVDESAVIVLKYKGGGLANLTYHTAAGL
ncbi:trans-1,2-dihydrobenzene-1,2-diol dehydrogenase-like [Dreissena polymorpha]|uniref:trans-1,2-dihydrobenzene-1,2-diol dehydrogenase-like n=1 Tax=Dreissena polymorpha TaxID=45954 RepID=UPI0022651786|nr:trans-1,2-dihydrobenzene-1,2-diol dehydrogenase-like [Dreissena polymorpha]